MKKGMLIALFVGLSLIFSQSAIGADTKVYILDNGYIECDANWMVTGTVVGTAKMKNPPARWIQIPCYVALIDHPKGKILFDLGTHPDANTIYAEVVLAGWPLVVNPWTLIELFPYHCDEDQRLERQLALVGLKPADISTVVLSHLHFDHCGNLHLFDHADIYVHPAEVKANPHVTIKKPRLVDEDTEIFPGVEIITLPGHTDGVLGLVVHLKEDGTLIFPSDAINMATNYGPPVKASGIIHDSLSFFKSLEKVRGIEEQYSGKVMFSHDMEFFNSLKKAPQYYN
jgi:glyoxylase-like metal-dependent hydrolase (beta-lactamase superfamily II)